MNRSNQYTYAAVLTKEADGGYSVRFPQLDGCFTQGDTLSEALRMASDAMSLHLYGMEQDGDAIPEADLEGTKAEAGELVVPVTVWMTPFREEMENRAVKKTLTIPQWMNEAAEKQGINFSQVLQEALAAKLTHAGT